MGGCGRLNGTGEAPRTTFMGALPSPSTPHQSWLSWSTVSRGDGQVRYGSLSFFMDGQ